MRVIAGLWRGRSLQAPAGRGTRPTGDKVREAIFDVLCARLGPLPPGSDSTPLAAGDRASTRAAEIALPLAGHRALDVFAGMGGLGIEALSRGAASCTFVERDPAALRALRENLRTLDVGAARGRVLAADFRRALAADVRAGRRYTLVFVDPPYAEYATVEPELTGVLGKLLSPGAVVVVETARGQAVDLPFETVRVKRYGDTHVTFLEAGPAPVDEPATD